MRDNQLNHWGEAECLLKDDLTVISHLTANKHPREANEVLRIGKGTNEFRLKFTKAFGN